MLVNRKHKDSPGVGKTPEDRREYNNWYYRNIRAPDRETWEEAQARYHRMSEDYWRDYCIDKGLDPEGWEEVKKQVQHEKWVRKQLRRRGIY